jgi:drug/metabolite transporter (DMT)-like permease
MADLDNETRAGRYASDVKMLGVATAAHTGLGLYVVLVKYLLRYLPAFRLLAVAFGIAAPVTFVIARRAWNWRSFRKAGIWLLSGFMMVRSITKLLALQFTLATTMQLIDLAVPCFTPILAWLLLREAMPSRTLVALAAVSLGSFLVIVADPFHVRLPNGISDLIGIALALASSLAMAAAVVYTRYLTMRDMRPAGVVFQQLLVGALTYSVLSALRGESWEPFASLPVSAWMIYIFFILVALAGGLLQVLAISRVNATLFSTLLSWRLVVAVAAGWPLLGERLASIWQAIGVVMVILTISLYLRHQAGGSNVAGKRRE